jgi:hypothetical protein
MALALGFAVAGCLAAGFQLVMRQPVSFGLLHRGPSRTAFVALSVICFAAPFIIMRYTLNARPLEDRSFQLTFFATVVAGLWSLMSGTVLVTALHAVGLLAA